MLIIQKFKNQKISFLGIIKIVIIILSSIFLLGSFIPFYLGLTFADAYVYGFMAINIVNGSFEYTNEFIQNPEYYGFVFGPWIKTIHGTVIPEGNIGIYGLASFSYLLAGNYALFYLGPIATILFLIITERVISKLFGSFAGLVALIFLATDSALLYAGRQLLTDSIFGILILLGCYFLLNFLKEKNNISILLCSSFLTVATFFRFTGVIFFPIEILIVISYFFFNYIKNRNEGLELNSNKSQSNFLKTISKNRIKKFLKFALYILGPWSVFFIFLFSFNSYFFGEPFTTYLEQRRGIESENIISSFLMFDSERLDSVISYSTLILPDQINNQLKKVSFNSDLSEPFLTIIFFSFLFSALFISLKYKIKGKEIIVFIIFILGLLLFYSSDPVVSLTKVVDRYMMAALPLFFGIIGYLMYQGWKINYQKISLKYVKTISKSWKGFLIIIFVIFFLTSFFYSGTVRSLITEQYFKFENPQVFSDRYPLDLEKLSEKSIILHGKDRTIIWEYNAIPFNPFTGYSDANKSWFNINAKINPIKTMNELLDKGYNLYVFKEKNQGDPSYYRYLESEQGLILKEYSKTFCKLIRIDGMSGANNTQIQSDDICHSFLE